MLLGFTQFTKQQDADDGVERLDLEVVDQFHRAGFYPAQGRAGRGFAPGNIEHFRRKVNSGDAQSEPGQAERHVARSTTQIQHIGATGEFHHPVVDTPDVAEGKETDAEIVTPGCRLKQAHPDISTHVNILTLRRVVFLPSPRNGRFRITTPCTGASW